MVRPLVPPPANLLLLLLQQVTRPWPPDARAIATVLLLRQADDLAEPERALVERVVRPGAEPLGWRQKI